MDERDQRTIRRRGFLGLLGAGGLTAIGAAAPLAGCSSSTAETSERQSKPRFRETAEVKTFYRVNSYPR